MKFRFALVTILMLVLPAAGASQGDLEQARTYFENAQRQGLSHQEQIDWLERSLETYPTYRAAYELGKLHRKAGDHNRALAQFHHAFSLTDQEKYLAQGAYQIGITHQTMDRYVEARHWLRKSLGFSDHEAVRQALRELELSRKGRVLGAAEILEELRIERSFGVAKAELRVHFELNQASLDSVGYRQAIELGRALNDRHWQSRGEIFYLLGHTDRLCPRGRPDRLGCDRYNLELSERRAASVSRVLTDELGLEPNRIRAVGCGRLSLLSDRESAEDHYLNRRVVVMALERPASHLDELCAHDSGLM